MVEKCVAVIDSCSTQEQLKSAVNYVALAYNYMKDNYIYDELIKLISLKERVLYYEQIKKGN
jgi:hypothetical protein